jgi:FtsH-binding integral membrane protein
VEFLQSITGKLVTGGIALALVAGGISWWQMDPATRQAMFDNATRGGAWFVLVLLIPWLLFWLVARVARMDSNAAGAALVTGVTLVEALWLGVMFGFHGYSPAGWGLFAAAVCVAGVYNLFACDWIAEKVS